jgi:uncharacterized membrane protein
MLARLCGPFFIAAGINHFVNPKFYLAIMPDYLPAHQELVDASGIAEMAGGVALLHPATRRFGGWWLIATLIAVFPANLHMALHPERYRKIPEAGLYARLPVQLLFIGWVRAAART